MPLTLIKEDGTGRSDANSYADAAEGDTFHEGHLYATDWTGASGTTKAAALVLATRLIDAYYQFRGFKVRDAQALQWPRDSARDDDAPRAALVAWLTPAGNYFANNSLPAALRNGTIETAREFIRANRADDPDGEGLAVLALTGTLRLTFDKTDRPPVIPHVAQAMLSKLGEYSKPISGMARLVRT